VRNPWARELSLFDHARGEPTHSHYALYQRMSFDDYVYWRCDNQLPSQRSKLCGPNGDLLVNAIGRYERLRDDFGRIQSRIGVPAAPLPRLNVGSRPGRDYRECYTPETRALVHELCRDDVEYFGYAF